MIEQLIGDTLNKVSEGHALSGQTRLAMDAIIVHIDNINQLVTQPRLPQAVCGDWSGESGDDASVRHRTSMRSYLTRRADGADARKGSHLTRLVSLFQQTTDPPVRQRQVVLPPVRSSACRPGYQHHAAPRLRHGRRCVPTGIGPGKRAAARSPAPALPAVCSFCCSCRQLRSKCLSRPFTAEIIGEQVEMPTFASPITHQYIRAHYIAKALADTVDGHFTVQPRARTLFAIACAAQHLHCLCHKRYACFADAVFCRQVNSPAHAASCRSVRLSHARASRNSSAVIPSSTSAILTARRALTAGRSDFCRRSAADDAIKTPPSARRIQSVAASAQSKRVSRPSSEFAGHLHPLRPAASRKHQELSLTVTF